MLPTNAKSQTLPQRCIAAPATRIEPADNHLAPKTSTNHLTMRPAAEERMNAMLGDDRPTPPPTHCARVADAPTPQPARDSPPWHPGILPRHPSILPNETSMPTVHHATPATRDDVPARMSGTGQAESPLGSCRAGLEHPSMSSNTSTSLLGCGRLCIPSCSLEVECCTSEPALAPSSRADAPPTSNMH